MNKKELLKLIEKGENQRVEFKEKFNKETIETATAFANTNDGVILIGISNKEYQELNNVSKRTSTLDLKDLVNKGVFRRIGRGKREMKYVLLDKSIQKVSKKEYGTKRDIR